MSERKEVFTQIFQHNIWGDSESVSGGASRLDSTINLRKVLPRIIDAYKIKSILDAPCGDMNWFSHLDINDVKYHGCDIVDKLIEKNKKAFCNKKNYSFEVKDLISEKLPEVDLILCRDLIIHLPITSIYALLHNFVNSKSKYLLITQHVMENPSNYPPNLNIKFGDFAYRNLTKEPFNFPQPSLLIADQNENKKRDYSRFLAFYDMETIEKALK